MRTVLRNGVVYEPVAGEHLGERTVVIEDGTIVDVVEGKWSGEFDVDLDARGRHVLPGFIDGHIHLSIPSMDLARLAQQWEFEKALAIAALSEATVRRGFTTVRDTGGDLRGLRQSIGRGLCGGPRIVSAGHMLSQTGGHADLRGPVVDPPECGCQIITSQFAHVADGPSAVRKAARQSLRDGSDFIKIHTSGGVASPSDPLDSVQFTAEEISTIVTAAEHRHTYVTAHAYSPESMRLAADNGVACLEHGNLVDAATAAHLAELGTTVVPTLVTYWALRDSLNAAKPKMRVYLNRDGRLLGCCAMLAWNWASVRTCWAKLSRTRTRSLPSVLSWSRRQTCFVPCTSSTPNSVTLWARSGRCRREHTGTWS